MERVPKRVIALFVIATIATALGSLTQTVTNAMLHGIEADFAIGAEVAQWLTTIYMLVMGITVPLVTYLSHKFSLKNLVLISLFLSLIGALADLYAPNFEVMVVGRVLQAASAGITMPLLQSIAMTRFPEGRKNTAMGIAGIAMGFAPNIGPIIGGALVDTWGWRSFFAILAAVVGLLLISTAAFVPQEKPSEKNPRLDTISFMLSTLGFGGLLLGFSNAASMSLASPAVITPVLVGLACLLGFVSRQKRVREPLISMHIFDSARFRISFVAQNCLFASFMGITLIVPMFVEGVCGGTAFEAGLVFLPATVLAFVTNPVAGYLTDKIGIRPVALFASLCLFVGAFGMVFVHAGTSLIMLSLLQTIRGIGVSCLIGPITSWGLSDLPKSIVMDGSGFFAAVRQACASLGTAIMVFLITSISASSAVASGAAPLSFAYDVALGFSAFLSLCVFVCVLWKVHSHKEEQQLAQNLAASSNSSQEG